MLLNVIPLMVMIGCVVFYYRVGSIEYESGLPLAGASFALWVASELLGANFVVAALVQVGLFIALTLYNVVKWYRESSVGLSDRGTDGSGIVR